MSNDTQKAAYDLLSDPLSSVTRATKKTLFIFATLCCLVGYTGVIPEEASVFGFRFPGLTPSVIELALFVLLFYSFISFAVHLASDWCRSRIVSNRYSLARGIDAVNSMSPPDDEEGFHARQFELESGHTDKSVSHGATKSLGIIKLVLDFYFPLVFGLGSIIYFYVMRLA
ncbi:hypothetical protein [Luteolibacter sp. AS25]|uniref:hypothetical protein n=1 Tax=Luteolibacter sp. AS25 TaxID=3135776 RepID=UPI00398AAAB8